PGRRPAPPRRAAPRRGGPRQAVRGRAERRHRGRRRRLPRGAPAVRAGPGADRTDARRAGARAPPLDRGLRGGRSRGGAPGRGAPGAPGGRARRVITVVSFVVVVGLLILIHELGHFLVARWVGVGV